MVTETMIHSPAPALILFSHGSLVCGAARALEAHADFLRRSGDWSQVRIGWMNYDAPTFAEAVQITLENASIDTIVVVPYFLVPGRFVTHDLRNALAAAREAHPGVTFLEAAPLGTGADWLAPIAQLAAMASPLTAESRAATIAQVIAGCEGKPRCPLREDGLCSGEPRSPSTPVPSPRISPANAVPDDDRPSLLVLAHGSPREAANAAVHELAVLLRDSRQYAGVHTGFLDCAQPDIPTAAHAAAASDARSVVALPFFLHTGRHVILDVPDLLMGAATHHPNVEFHLAPFLGSSPALGEMLAVRALTALSQPK
jgi:sirohydrochlorin cobaltochelatase